MIFHIIIGSYIISYRLRIKYLSYPSIIPIFWGDSFTQPAVFCACSQVSTLTITPPMRCFWLMLPREYTLSQYDSSPPLTACTILVMLIQVEEYTCLNTDSSKILVSNIKWIIHNFLHLSECSVMTWMTCDLPKCPVCQN